MVILGSFKSLANGLLRFSYISLPCYLQCLQNLQCFFRRAVLSLILRERQIEVIGVAVVCNYIKPMIPVIVRNNLSCNEQTSIRVWMLVCLCSPQTQCTGTVRIIAPSQIDGKEGFRLLCKLELNQLLRLKSISAFLA